MVSPSRPASRNRMPTVLSICMASPEPLRSRNDLTLMEVDHILVLVGSDPTGLLPSERRDRAWQLYQQGQVVRSHDGWELYWAINL